MGRARKATKRHDEPLYWVPGSPGAPVTAQKHEKPAAPGKPGKRPPAAPPKASVNPPTLPRPALDELDDEDIPGRGAFGRPSNVLRQKCVEYAIERVLARKDIMQIARDMQVTPGVLVRWIVQDLTKKPRILSMLDPEESRSMSLVLPSGARLENVSVRDVMAFEYELLADGNAADFRAKLRRGLQRRQAREEDDD